MQETNSEQVHSPEYSTIQRVKKERHHFPRSMELARRQPNTAKEQLSIPYPSKIGKFLPEYLILQGCPELFLSIKIQNTTIPQGKRNIFNRAPYFVSVPSLSTEQIFSQLMLYCPENLKLPGKKIPQSTIFTEQLPVTALATTAGESTNQIPSSPEKVNVIFH